MYERLKNLDGRHPWRGVCPDGYVDYRARRREGGKVVYFNFDLAIEMELIPANHARRITRELERAVLETFALQIINEYDLSRGQSEIDEESIRPHPYMATRYLQLQHKDKRGLTSGDGRGIWNGSVRTHRGITYDISSRGTGATCLSPGAQLANGPVKTGDDSWGYSCGTADLDEGLATAVMSEIFHRNGFPTERTLAVIDFPGEGTAIGVRASPNLIRPAHIFRYLKQGRHAELKASFDYFIERQVRNREWKLPAQGSRRERYRRVLTHIARSYGRLAAICEEEYIFNWLAWDGDNMLASGAILDYGSIRQFAAKHDKYRYDDDDRFSSSLTEQRYWARELVKVFAQVAHFARTGRKRNLRHFKNVDCLRQFDQWFEREREWRILWRLGFTPQQIELLRERGRSEIGDLRRALAFFEEVKVARGMEKTPDGVTHRPVFLIRSLLRELPAFYLNECDGKFDAMMDPARFCGTMAASYATRRDLKLTQSRIARAGNFQKCYQRLIAAAGPYERVLRQIAKRSAVINHEHRMTGNASIQVIDRIIAMKEDFSATELQELMDCFVQSQVLIPGEWKPISDDQLEGNSARPRLLRALQKDLDECKETL
ncbi:MAG TPA: protein adenylyltransferase SelO family protein [Tepidisphaeraceae bacterium]